MVETDEEKAVEIPGAGGVVLGLLAMVMLGIMSDPVDGELNADYRGFLIGYPLVVALGLRSLSWLQLLGENPKRRLAVWLSFVLPVFLLIAFLAISSGFALSWAQLLKHVGAAMIPAAFFVAAWLERHFSVKWRWVNVAGFGVIALAVLVGLAERWSARGGAFSSFSGGSLILFGVIGLVALAAVALNIAALRRGRAMRALAPDVEKEAAAVRGAGGIFSVILVVIASAVAAMLPIQGVGEAAVWEWNEALYQAVSDGDREKVTMLLERGGTSREMFPDALAEAAGRDDIGLMKDLVDAGAPPGDGCRLAQSGNVTPLLVAVERDRMKSIDWLIQAGADLDANGRVYRGIENVWVTPLILAIIDGKEAIARRLLEGGADPDALAERIVYLSPLMMAILYDRNSLIPVLIEAGATVDQTDDSGWTALHYAASRGDEKAVRALLFADADHSIANADGDTATDLARKNGHDAGLLFPLK